MRPKMDNQIKALPDGYAVVPISEEQLAAPLRINVVIKLDPKPGEHFFITLRQSIDARVLLGCITDVGGCIHEWVELAFQDSGGCATVARRGLCSNSVLDQRWRRQSEVLIETQGSRLWLTGWECNHPRPTLLDPVRLRPVHPVDPESNENWELCQDEDLLSRKGLPPYGGSLYRYLYIRSQEDASLVIPAVPEAPVNEACLSWQQMHENGAVLIPMNIGAGMMRVVRRAPLSVDSYLELLDGGTWVGMGHGVKELDFQGRQEPEVVGSQQRPRRALLNPRGCTGRLIESFYLRLQLLRQMMLQVSKTIQATQCPMFNIRPESFRVDVVETLPALPSLWTTEVTLVEAGAALSTQLPNTNVEVFVPAEPSGSSIYLPHSVHSSFTGRALVRIRDIISECGSTELELSLVTQERLAVNSNGFIILTLSLPCGPMTVSLQNRVGDLIVPNHYRFRSLPNRLSQEQLDCLRPGLQVTNCDFEYIPGVGVASDIYSLAVIGTQMLLASPQTQLAAVLDDLLALSSVVATANHGQREVAETIELFFNSDMKWGESLGPQAFISCSSCSGNAAELLPHRLWYEALAILVSMVPAVGPHSYCQAWDVAIAGGDHLIINQPLREVEQLLNKIEGLLLSDWESNQEMQIVLERYLTVPAGE